MPNANNPRIGNNFEQQVKVFFGEHELALQSKMTVLIGVGDHKKLHNFDLGSRVPPVLVECKCHVWTEGGNAPSAKLTIWNEAMLYFALTPPGYRKLLVVQRSVRGVETLAEYYLKCYAHLIPPDVELWEYDSVSGRGRCLHGCPTAVLEGAKGGRN